MLLLIFTLVRAPDVGWSNARTIAELVAAIVLLAAFVRNERGAATRSCRSRSSGSGPRARERDPTLSFGGLYAMFFFLSLYMQNVLGYSPINTGLAYLPVTGGFMIAVAVATPLMPRIGTKPVIVTGALVASGRNLRPLARTCRRNLPRQPPARDRARRPSDSATVFTGVTTAATDGVAPRQGGRRLGPAQRLHAVRRRARPRRPLGRRHTADEQHPRLGGASPLALTAGFQRAFLVGTGFVLAAAAIAATAANRRPGKSSVGATT